MKKILVPTDFSNNALKAVDYAVAIAEKADAEIILLNAFMAVDTTLSARKGLFDEYNNSIAVDSREQLKDLKENIEKNQR